MTTPTPPPVPVAGMLVPAALVPSIVASMRGVYPTVTEGLGDDAAVRAVLKHWVTSTLATWAAQQASAPVAEQVAALQAEAEALTEQARSRAERAAQAIIEAGPDPSSPSPFA